MIDLHTHILCGVDDGAEDLGESLATARALVAAGTETVAATPHVRDDYPNSADTIERLVRDLGAELAVAGIPLRVVMGAEVAIDRLPYIPKGDLPRLSIAGGGRYLLVESPYHGWPLEIPQRLFELGIAGLTPVIAHPERNPAIQDDPETLRPLVEAGALVQVTAASLAGALGRASRATGRRLIESGLAHVVASDAHAPAGRALDLRAAAESAGGAAMARWLTSDVPAAIIAGETPPPPPVSRRSGRGWWRRGR